MRVRRRRIDWRCRAFLAKAVLRFQRSQLSAVCGEAALHSRNPVKQELCERPEDWQWSSFRHYATGAEGRVEIESERTGRKRERVAGKLCPAVELPHSSQNRA